MLKTFWKVFLFYVRPWIIVIEITLQGTYEDISNSWVYLILQNNYSHDYFDGINKYYLAQKKTPFHQPLHNTNILDDWIHIEHKHVLENEQRLKKMAKQRRRLAETIKTLERVCKPFVFVQESILSSKSWKITKPLALSLF